MEEYQVYDGIFALLRDEGHLGARGRSSISLNRSAETTRRPEKKQIFVTSFNLFKKALAHDKICRKIWPPREQILVIADEVDVSWCVEGLRADPL